LFERRRDKIKNKEKRVRKRGWREKEYKRKLEKIQKRIIFLSFSRLPMLSSFTSPSTFSFLSLFFLSLLFYFFPLFLFFFFSFFHSLSLPHFLLLPFSSSFFLDLRFKNSGDFYTMETCDTWRNQKGTGENKFYDQFYMIRGSRGKN
jgi:hypothetical protein